MGQQKRQWERPQYRYPDDVIATDFVTNDTAEQYAGEAPYAQFSTGSLIGATAANLQVFGTSKDFGNTRRNRSFGAGKLPSEGSEFH